MFDFFKIFFDKLSGRLFGNISAFWSSHSPLRWRDDRSQGQGNAEEKSAKRVRAADGRYPPEMIGDGAACDQAAGLRDRGLRLRVVHEPVERPEPVGGRGHVTPLVQARPAHRPHVDGPGQQIDVGGREQLDGNGRRDEEHGREERGPVNAVRGPDARRPVVRREQAH